jgi:hypothetical protein
MAIGLGLLSPLGAEAAGTDCTGTWRFEVARPTPEQEALVSPDSWCRAAKLPRTFTAELRLTPDGHGIITGTPQPPTDVNTWAGRCEFQFSGPANGPKHDDITMEVSASGTVLQGEARCMEHIRESPEKSGAIGFKVVFTGNHSPGDGVPVPAPTKAALPGPDKLAAVVVTACRRRDADALWKVMTPRFQSEVDNRAEQVRHAAGSDLRRLFGYKGRPADFNGLAYLRTTVKRDDSSMNPCWHSDAWKLNPAVATAGGYVATVERGDVTSGFTFTKNDRGWQLDQISKWVPVPKP